MDEQNSGAKNRRDPKTVWIGAGLSAALFLIFFLMQLFESDLLALPLQYVFVALIPLVVSLLMSGYITSIKAWQVEVSTADAAIKQPLADAKKVANAAVPVSKVEGGRLYKVAPSVHAKAPEGWPAKRADEYDRTQRYMLAHVYKPSRDQVQRFDISIFVTKHVQGSDVPPPRHFPEIKKAEFFFGESWGNKIFATDGEGGFFGVRTQAWGSFLALCHITFRDENQPPIDLFRFIDFSMLEPGN